jgi:adenylate cyclase
MAAKRAKASAGTAANGGRRLVVVVAFDVVNFSALVEADEERVLGAWRALRQAIDPLITAGGGRIFKALGDGLLVEFTGPVDATRTALAVQAAVAGPNLTPDTAVRLKLRCAIHMGEVTVEGPDLLGDGINIVSRLQEHAPIGGVLVSAAVMDLIAGRIEEPIEELGPLKLRNMSRAPKVVAGHANAVGRDGNDRRLPATLRRPDPRAAPRGSATGLWRTSSPPCRTWTSCQGG